MSVSHLRELNPKVMKVDATHADSVHEGDTKPSRQVVQINMLTDNDELIEMQKQTQGAGNDEPTGKQQTAGGIHKKAVLCFAGQKEKVYPAQRQTVHHQQRASMMPSNYPIKETVGRITSGRPAASCHGRRPP